MFVLGGGAEARDRYILEGGEESSACVWGGDVRRRSVLWGEGRWVCIDGRGRGRRGREGEKGEG